ncbi:kinase-like protein [Microstroma glucosiphilum]|uniref:Kinase-like protein n=1 Tax=Pseudomicrostroma glucosiphilum TaxID=1684307 RepID=A0A316UFN9_9BASI|nr:kinase-like protein [Pseudomicrostroma glucosiphilum]PWN23714.1 kinase-like protein [Pseudomicrostroma glucosiphilum]
MMAHIETSAGSSSASGASSSYSLPDSLIAATHKPRALDYLTRGLTSQIYTFDLDKWQQERSAERKYLDVELQHLGAAPLRHGLLVKCVDLDEQPRPHDILREIDILKRLRGSADQRRDLVVALLHDEEEVPDDFTTIQRLYFPRYPTTLATFLFEEANTCVESILALSDSQRHTFAHHLALQLFSALDFLHSNGIYHRDVKPGNILLSGNPTNDDPASISIRLCDFGTAFVSSSKKERPSTSSTSTHPYTPPELLFSPTGGYDGAAVDVWEVACVVAEVLGEVSSDADEGEAQSGVHLVDEDENAFERSEDEDERMERDLERQCLWPSGPSLADDDDYDDGVNDESAEVVSRPRFTIQRSKKSYRRQTLFKEGRGDIVLAADIFTLLGLPEGDREDLWPEAVHFHPPLARLPFTRAPAPAMPRALQERLPTFTRVLTAGEKGGVPKDVRERAEVVQDVLVGCLKLSARQRLGTQEIIARLDRVPVSNPGATDRLST